VSTADLVRPDRLGPALAEATGDGRWRSPGAELIAGGKSNLTFELTSAAGALILRRPPSGELLPSAHDMGREARIQRALAATSVPVPKIVLTEPGADLLGVPFYVMEKVPGHIIRDELPDGYAQTPAEKLALTDALVDVLADLRRREPIFHRPEFGTTRTEFEAMVENDFWEVGASGRRYARKYILEELEKRARNPEEEQEVCSPPH